LAPGWCILPVAQAIELCATLPGCHWAITTNAGWNSAYPKSAQLGYAPLIANAEWTTYAPQGFWTTTSGTLWSQPITNCPGTLAAGWCILPQYKAIEYCATIPGCVWSVTTNAGWNSAYSNSAQLGYAPLINNAEWTSYTQPGPWTHVTGHLWSKQIVCPGSLAPGWCILPVAQAISLCATIPGCHWAITTNAGWNSAYPRAAQLGYAPLIANAEWTTYAPQGFWGLNSGTLWSHPIQNCPGTLASGWCILPHFRAIEYCATIPGCVWSVTTNLGWNSAYPNSAQLGYGPLINNAEWTSYTQPGPWSHVTGQIWSKQIVNCTGTLAPGWCILPVAQAINLCATISGCHWAITTNAGWNSAYPKSAQLGYAPLIANAEWTTYVPLF